MFGRHEGYINPCEQISRTGSCTSGNMAKANGLVKESRGSVAALGWQRAQEEPDAKAGPEATGADAAETFSFEDGDGGEYGLVGYRPDVLPTPEVPAMVSSIAKCFLFYINAIVNLIWVVEHHRF
jgi:hypothetical protein